MVDLLCPYDMLNRATWRRSITALLAPEEKFGKAGRHVMHRTHVQCAILVQVQHAELGVANTHRVFEHGIEHGLEGTRRARYDLEHLAGRRLLLQRFTQFVEQTSVLDGNDGLTREVTHQRDLL